MPTPTYNSKDDAAIILGEALQAAHDGYMENARRMGRPAVTFTRWQKFKIWFLFKFGRRHKAQSIILEEIKEGE